MNDCLQLFGDIDVELKKQKMKELDDDSDLEKNEYDIEVIEEVKEEQKRSKKN